MPTLFAVDRLANRRVWTGRINKRNYSKGATHCSHIFTSKGTLSFALQRALVQAAACVERGLFAFKDQAMQVALNQQLEGVSARDFREWCLVAESCTNLRLVIHKVEGMVPEARQVSVKVALYLFEGYERKLAYASEDANTHEKPICKSCDSQRSHEERNYAGDQSCLSFCSVDSKEDLYRLIGLVFCDVLDPLT